MSTISINRETVTNLLREGYIVCDALEDLFGVCSTTETDEIRAAIAFDAVRGR